MHCLAFPSALFGAPFHIDNRTVANCGFWLEYASKTPLEVGADLPRRMRLFWLRCQIMRLRSVHIKPHYSQNAFDSALLAWYERGISFKRQNCKICNGIYGDLCHVKMPRKFLNSFFTPSCPLWFFTLWNRMVTYCLGIYRNGTLYTQWRQQANSADRRPILQIKPIYEFEFLR